MILRVNLITILVEIYEALLFILECLHQLVVVIKFIDEFGLPLPLILHILLKSFIDLIGPIKVYPLLLHILQYHFLNKKIK